MGSFTAADRLDRLREAMRERDLGSLLITAIPNLRWLTGFTGSHGFALVTQTDAWIAVDSRYTIQAEQQCPCFARRMLQSSASENLCELIKATVSGEVAFESDSLSVGAFDDYRDKLQPEVAFTPHRAVIRDLRATKDAAELAAIREACRIAHEVFAFMCGVIRPGISERDVMLEIEWRIRKEHRADVAFPSIAVSGPRSAMPHGTPSDRVLAPGDFVTLDFGARYEGYCSDITRTVVLGAPTDQHVEVYGIVREAQLRAIEAARPGMSGKDVDAVARDWIADCGRAEHFGHGLGHSLGLEVHDGVGMGITSQLTLRPGMVLTFEPGVYIPDWGGVRIEDDVLITETGREVLTHADRDLIAL
jgi:Xaa-Pro aminopeptidase